MLKQKVVVKGPASVMRGKMGIVVAELILSSQDFSSNDGPAMCKVLIGEKISGWIPVRWLESVSDFRFERARENEIYSKPAV